MSSQQPINPLIQNPNVKMQNGFGMNVTSGEGVNPSMAAQMVDGQALTNAAADAATDNFVGRHIKAYDEVDQNEKLMLTVPVAVAINTAMDKYLKLYDGEYSKSLAGKIGNFGDKVSDLITENPIGRFFSKVKNNVKPFAKKHIYDKSAMLRAFVETPTSPEFKMAKSQMNMGKDFALSSYINACENFIKPLKSVKDFDSLGASKADIERIEDLIKNASSEVEKKNIFYREQYKLLRPNATAQEINNFLASPKIDEAMKEIKLKSLNFANNAEFELYSKNSNKYFNEIMQKLEKTNPKLVSKIWLSDANVLTKISGFFAGRKISFQQVRNILLSSLGSQNTMHRTSLGRGLNKAVNLTMEALTGRMYQGKLSTLMQGYFVAEALLAASKQDSVGDKVRSFAERMVDFVGFMLFIGPCIKLMHRIGGLKNWGMTPDKVKIYEQAVKEFNEKVARGDYIGNKKAYNFGLKRLKVLGRPKTRNPFVWLGRKVGDFVTTGLKDTIRPYSRFKHGEFNMFEGGIKQIFKNIPRRIWDAICNPKYWFKRMAGWPIRFMIPMMMLSIPNKYLTKLCHAVLGKPKYSLEDEDKYKQQEELDKQAQELIKQQQSLQNQNNGETNLIKQFKNSQKTDSDNNKSVVNDAKLSNSIDNKNSENSTVTNTQTVTQNQDNNKTYEPVRTYVPSSVGMVPQSNEDSSQADKAMEHASEAEKEILRILKG
ncbi:hypothetical protein J6G99_07975 [bacterium]|nr:hypothetical protein [bacterium]